MATTALQGLPYPVGSDTPAGNTQILTLANAIEKKAVMVFASAAARTSALSAASVAPTEGMLCWLEDVNRYEYYTGSAWVRLPGMRTGCRLRRVAAQSIPSGAVTAIAWDTEDEDTDAFIAVTASTITIPAGLGGLYDFSLWANAQAVEATFHSNRNYIDIAITAAATGIPASFRMKVDSVEDQTTVSALNVPIAPGDTIQGRYFQDTGSAQNLAAAWITCYRKSA
ncbi:MAG TPA: hypothetical protein VMU51_34290 [Mycobacteriales bacterium]|nr:hypothetical protein [Mycobacteriales bacterium]